MGGGGSKPKTSTTVSGTPDWSRPYVESAARDAQNLYKSGAFNAVAGMNNDQLSAQHGARVINNDAFSLSNDARALSNTAGTDPAYGRAQGVYSDASSGNGMFGAGHMGTVMDQMQPQINNQITQALGQQSGQFAQSGNLGGARAQAASAGAAGQISSNMAASEVAAQRAGAMSGAQGGVQTADAVFGQKLSGLGARGSGLQGTMAANGMLASSGQDQQDQAQAQMDARYQGIQRMFGLVNPNTVGSKSETTSTGGK